MPLASSILDDKLADDEPVYFGDNKEYELKKDSTTGKLVIEHGSSGTTFQFDDQVLDVDGTPIFDLVAGHVPDAALQQAEIDAATVGGLKPSELRVGFDYTQPDEPNADPGEEWYATGGGSFSEGAYIKMADGSWKEQSVEHVQNLAGYDNLDSDGDYRVDAADRAFKVRSVQSKSDLPSNAEEDEFFYVKDEQSIFVEDGS